MVCMVKKSCKSFWCLRGHGVKFFSIKCHLSYRLQNILYMSGSRSGGKQVIKRERGREVHEGALGYIRY